MLDPNGNMVTSTVGIANLATEHFKKVLENREIKKDLKHVQLDKEELAKHRLDLSKANQSPPWTMKELEKVLSYLKNNNSRDPLGNVYKIFKNNVAILLLMNHIKKKHEYPEIFRLCNITAIYKKGQKE